MYNYGLPKASLMKINNTVEGESIENKIHRILNNNEPIKDGTQTIYTERKHGVNPAYDIRADKWEIGLDAMEKVTQQKLAKREEKNKTLGEKAKEGMDKEQKSNSGEPGSAPGTTQGSDIK